MAIDSPLAHQPNSATDSSSCYPHTRKTSCFKVLSPAILCKISCFKVLTAGLFLGPSYNSLDPPIVMV